MKQKISLFPPVIAIMFNVMRDNIKEPLLMTLINEFNLGVESGKASAIGNNGDIEVISRECLIHIY
jgi:hypothetical protein